MDRYDHIVEVRHHFEEIQEVRKFNPYHAKDGRFSNANGGTGGGLAYNAGDPNGVVRSANGGYFDETDTKKFTDAVATAQSKIPPAAAWRVAAPSQEDFEADHPGAKMHITKNGSTVAVAADGDIVAVCATKPDHGMDLINLAVENGGTKGDSFSGLYGFYRKAGLEPRTACAFDEKYAPPGWTKGRDKPEPIIFWEYTGNKSTKSQAELARELDGWLASQKIYSGDSGYGDAMAARDAMMKGGGK